MDTTFKTKTDSMHDRCMFSGDAQEEGRVKEGGMLLCGQEDLSVAICEPRPEGKEDGVMQR